MDKCLIFPAVASELQAQLLSTKTLQTFKLTSFLSHHPHTTVGTLKLEQCTIYRIVHFGHCADIHSDIFISELHTLHTMKYRVRDLLS